MGASQTVLRGAKRYDGPPAPPPPTFELFIPSTTIIKKMHNLPFIGCLCLKQMILEMPMESECISQMEFELNESQNNARIRHKSGLHTGERVFSVCCIQKYVHRYKAGRHFSERTQRSSQPTSLLCHTDSRWQIASLLLTNSNEHHSKKWRWFSFNFDQ